MSGRSPAMVIDATDIHRPSGVRTAVFELLSELFRKEPGWRYHVLVSRREAAFDLPQVTQHVVPVDRRILQRGWVQAAVIWLVLFRRARLVHYARTMGGLAWPARSILTVFDVTTLVRPELHSSAAKWYWRHVVPLHLRMADHIIAISENVADDLAAYYDVPRQKISVIYCAPQSVFDEPVTPEAIAQVRGRHALPERYLLFVGMLARKKNLATLINALAVLRREGEEAELVMVGRRYSQSDDVAIFDLIRERGLDSHVHYLGPVDSDDLRGLYGGAEMLVFPSLHEGFGIPCIEAMKCGIPVIAARSGAVPEVVGDAALLVDDPLDVAGYARAIRQLLTNADLRDEMIARGYNRAQAFRWPEIAEQTLGLYRRMVIRSRRNGIRQEDRSNG